MQPLDKQRNAMKERQKHDSKAAHPRALWAGPLHALGFLALPPTNQSCEGMAERKQRKTKSCCVLCAKTQQGTHIGSLFVTSLHHSHP